jgi:hypothetical protein
MPLNKPPEKKDDHAAHDREVRRAMNTPENANKAIETSRASINRLVSGRVWRHKTPHGDVEIKGSLLLDDSPVIVLHFSTEDATILPKGLRALTEGKANIISLVEARLKEIPQQITILDGAEFREPESCWAVPVVHQGRIVGHLKVSSDGDRILPDRKAVDELTH